MSKQPQAAAQLKGTPLWRMSKKFNFAAEKIIPDSFVFCIILTFLVFVLSLLLCGKSPLELLVGWWDGLSSQFTLAFQMGIMVVVCATCARSPQVNRLLNKMSSMVHSRTTALVLMMIFLGVSLLSSPRLILIRAISGLNVKLTGSTFVSSLISNGVSQTFVYMKS